MTEGPSNPFLNIRPETPREVQKKITLEDLDLKAGDEIKYLGKRWEVEHIDEVGDIKIKRIGKIETREMPFDWILGPKTKEDLKERGVEVLSSNRQEAGEREGQTLPEAPPTGMGAGEGGEVKKPNILDKLGLKLGDRIEFKTGEDRGRTITIKRVEPDGQVVFSFEGEEIEHAFIDSSEQNLRRIFGLEKPFEIDFPPMQEPETLIASSAPETPTETLAEIDKKISANYDEWLDLESRQINNKIELEKLKASRLRVFKRNKINKLEKEINRLQKLLNEKEEEFVFLRNEKRQAQTREGSVRQTAEAHDGLGGIWEQETPGRMQTGLSFAPLEDNREINQEAAGKQKKITLEEEKLEKLGLKKGQRVVFSVEFRNGIYAGMVGIIRRISGTGELILEDEEGAYVSCLPAADLTKKGIEKNFILEESPKEEAIRILDKVLDFRFRKAMVEARIRAFESGAKETAPGETTKTKADKVAEIKDRIEKSEKRKIRKEIVQSETIKTRADKIAEIKARMKAFEPGAKEAKETTPKKLSGKDKGNSIDIVV